MSALVTFSLLGWTPVVLLLFLLFKPRRAVIISFVAAWLFLPVKVPDLLIIKGLPELDKMTVTCLAVLLGTVLFDQRRLLSFRFKRYDIPMLLWCIVPLFASLTNTDSTVFGHRGIPNPVYDGLSEALKQTVTWGFPYLIGRVYFNNLAALRELAIGIFIGGLIYIPLCLYEFRFSPQLHNTVYGSHPHEDFRQGIRGDGYRPTVFMAHGLMVALWMATATLIGAWMWFSGSLRKVMGMPVIWCVIPMLGVTVWCKSLASLMLMCMGLAALYFVTNTRTRWPIIVLIALAPTYMALRATQVWDGMNAVALIENTISKDRAQSLGLRFSNENLLAERALEKPLFGWAGWGRSRIYDRFGKDISITDGMWVIALSKNGLVGLASLTAVILLPVWLTLKRIPVRLWSHPKAAPAAAMAIVLVLYMVDNLLNAMINPIFMLMAGALSAQVAIKTRPRTQNAAQSTEPDHTPEPPEETPNDAATEAA